MNFVVCYDTVAAQTCLDSVPYPESEHKRDLALPLTLNLNMLLDSNPEHISD